MENDFLKRIERQLRDIPSRDRQEILDDYRQHFDFGRSEGKSEQEIIDELGDPRLIAESIRSDYFAEAAHTEQKANIVRCLFVGFVMVLFNLIVIVGPLFGIIGGYFGLVAAAIGLMAAPFLSIFSLYESGLAAFLFTFFISLIACGVGMLLVAGLWIVGKGLWQLLVLYTRFNIRVITGRTV
ncbi:MAG: DUF1700 domain-containing protein [Sporolactobacillus sp.]